MPDDIANYAAAGLIDLDEYLDDAARSGLGDAFYWWLTLQRRKRARASHPKPDPKANP